MDIKITNVNVTFVSQMTHVMAYNLGEVSKAILWAMKYRDNPERCRAYLTHFATNLSDLFADICKIRKALGITEEAFEWLANEREGERRKEFAKKGRPYI